MPSEPDTGGWAAAPDLAEAACAWSRWLAEERRLATHSLDAYRRDLQAFLTFLTGHLGRPPHLADVPALTQADLRAWLAARHHRGMAKSSTNRALSAVRSFLRWLSRNGQADATALAAIKGPRSPRAQPLQLPPHDLGFARQQQHADEQEQEALQEGQEQTDNAQKDEDPAEDQDGDAAKLGGHVSPLAGRDTGRMKQLCRRKGCGSSVFRRVALSGRDRPRRAARPPGS